MKVLLDECITKKLKLFIPSFLKQIYHFEKYKVYVIEK